MIRLKNRVRGRLDFASLAPNYTFHGDGTFDQIPRPLLLPTDPKN